MGPVIALVANALLERGITLACFAAVGVLLGAVRPSARGAQGIATVAAIRAFRWE